MAKLNARFNLRIYKGEKPYLGSGRIELLELIMNTGSISKASKTMKMSYRKAWQLVKEMNELAKSPLVEKSPGGSMGGGACITHEGSKAVTEYKKLQKKIMNLFEAALRSDKF